MSFGDDFLNFDFEILFQLLLAISLGALIGFERELKRRPAGLRTHMLVSLGATVFTIVSLSFDVEPSRIAAGIVTGIGFLGAGNIIAHRGHISGITSAATLWVVAGIGLSIGVGQYLMGIIIALIVFAILQLGRLEKILDTEKNEKNYQSH